MGGVDHMLLRDIDGLNGWVFVGLSIVDTDFVLSRGTGCEREFPLSMYTGLQDLFVLRVGDHGIKL